VQAVTDKNGLWRAVLEPLKAGGPFEMTITGANKRVLKNVMVGEVWICSGQSNMYLKVNKALNAQHEIDDADYPKIRFFTTNPVRSTTPLNDVKNNWIECSSKTVGDFSAVGYYFGRQLHKEMNVPVGLIQSSLGGVVVESWIRAEAMKSDESFKPILQEWDRRIGQFDSAKAAQDYKLALEKWERESAAASQATSLSTSSPAGKPLPKPREAISPALDRNRPGALYNSTIAPLTSYAIRGAIWYQGEANAARAYQYRALLKTLITDWRKQWGQGDFPFIIVQLPNFHSPQTQPVEYDSWPELREAQVMALSLPNTAMACIIEMGEANDIHPTNKEEVGRRLALAAMGKVYEKKIEFMGPMYDSSTIEGNKIRIKFKHVGSGLAAMDVKNPQPASSASQTATTTSTGPSAVVPTKPILTPAKALTGFAIAGEDKNFVWAQATIDGDSIVVWSDKVANPVSVRYGWASNPSGNLYNKEELPASPFRTDNWPGKTDKNQVPKD